MSRPATPFMRMPPDGEGGGFCRRLPEVSADERDFWRRAVAQERQKLVLDPRPDAGTSRQDVH